MLNTLTANSFLPRRMLLAGATALSLLGGQAIAADKVPVTASFSILGDLVRAVGGERVAVTTLVAALPRRTPPGGLNPILPCSERLLC